jgi:hypothetical protein
MTNADDLISILVIGATGRMGLQVLRHLADHPSRPKVYAFCPTPSKLSTKDTGICASVIQGNALYYQDVDRAVAKSDADYVILITGTGHDPSNMDNNCQATGEILAKVMKQPQYDHVKAVIVSSNGAGGSKIIFGLGIGKLVALHLRKVLTDRTHQEKAFADLMDRTLIVRPTSLTDDKGGKVLVEFGDKEKGPSINTDRSDVAAWITKEVLGKEFAPSRKVNLTSSAT